MSASLIHGGDFGEEVYRFILDNQLGPEASSILLNAPPAVQAKVVWTGQCAHARDKVAVIKKRIVEASWGNTAVGEFGEEVEEFIRSHNFDEKAKHVLRVSEPDIQRTVLDAGPTDHARNPSAIILTRVREAQRDSKAKATQGVPKKKQQDPDMKAWYDAYGHMPPVQIDYSQLDPEQLQAYQAYADQLNAMTAKQALCSAMPMNQAGKDFGSFHEKKKKKEKGNLSVLEQLMTGSVDLNGITSQYNWNSSGSGSSDYPSVPIYWLSFDETSPLVQAGYPGCGPALEYEKNTQCFQSAHFILSEVVTDMGSSWQLDHDEDWKTYPAIAKAFKDQSGYENAFAVATSSEHGKWAAGFHAGKKGRESAAKLALAVAIVVGTPAEVVLCAKYPEFAAIMNGESTREHKRRKLGVDPAAAMGGGAPTTVAAPSAPAATFAASAAASAAASSADAAARHHAEWLAAKQAKEAGASASSGYMPAIGDADSSMLRMARSINAAAAAAESGSSQAGASLQFLTEQNDEKLAPECHDLTIPKTSPIMAQGFIQNGPAIIYKKDSQKYFDIAAEVLKTLLGTCMTSEIDNSGNYNQNPEIAYALRSAGLKENCFAVAMCPDLGRWAVGIAENSKDRERAASLALAMAVLEFAPHKQKTLDLFPLFRDLTQKLKFQNMCQKYK